MNKPPTTSFCKLVQNTGHNVEGFLKETEQDLVGDHGPTVMSDTVLAEWTQYQTPIIMVIAFNSNNYMS